MIPYYERDGITIYCGDCLKVMPGLEPPIDAIIADLPYGTTACEWDSVIPFEPLWMNYKRLIKRGGAIVLTASEPFASLLVVSNLLQFRYKWTWDKKQPTGHLNANKMPLQRTEDVLIFGDGQLTYNPQMRLRHRARIDKPRDKSYGGNGTQPYGSYKATGGTYTQFYPDTILEFQNANQTDKQHPTQKPIALMSYLIRTYTNPGELILDNTMGSGTTLVAAQNEGRRAIGIEISESYCQIAVERLRQPSFFSLPIQPAVKVEAEQAVMSL